MSFIKRIILFAALLASHMAMAGDACNMNGHWYLVSGPHFLDLKQIGGVIEGKLNENPGPCFMSFTGLVSGNEVNFQNVYSGTQCPYVYNIFKAQFAPDCMSISGTWSPSFDSTISYPFTMYRMPIRITEPDHEKELIITAEPRMPELTLKATLLPLLRDDPPVIPYRWGIYFKYPAIKDFNVIAKDVDTIDGVFTPDFGNLVDLSDQKEHPNRPVEGNIMGGELTVSVTYYNNLHDEKTYRFKGTNPGQIEIEQMITDKTLRQIACQESRYRQFEARREGGIGIPLISEARDDEGRGGVGIMQLYNPKATPEQAWDWRQNIKGGMQLYKEKYYGAVNLPKSELIRLNKKRLQAGLPACKSLPLLNAEQLERETLRRYNCGTEYQWEPWNTPDCKGQWVIDPSCRISYPRQYDSTYVDKVLACDINK